MGWPGNRGMTLGMPNPGVLPIGGPNQGMDRDRGMVSLGSSNTILTGMELPP